MTKNPILPTSVDNPPKPPTVEEILVWEFEGGTQFPPVVQHFASVKNYIISTDNTLMITGEDYLYVCPPGMWQSIYVKLVIDK